MGAEIMRGKHSQVTIFVIIALIIVVIIALAFLLIRGRGAIISPVADPQAYMANCVKDSLTKSETVILNGNFYPNITDNFILYYGKKVPYLCITSQFYLPCVNQEPMLIKSAEDNILAQAKIDANKCFADMIASFKQNGYEVKEENMNMSIRLDSNSITSDITKKITVTKDDETRNFEKFSASIISPIYRLAETTRNIVNYESALCEFNEMKWMMNYPDILIRRFSTSDQTKVYTLTDKSSGKSVNFAVKTCALPAGV
jgi:hypothetical protein